MGETGKFLMLGGAALLVLGAAFWGLSRAGLRGVPGDIHYQSGNVRVYFPIVTCLLLSLLVTGLLWLWRWLSSR